MTLPLVPQSQLEVRPIDWSGLNQRYLNPGELEVLCALLRSVKPRRVLEIGVNSGRTAKAILANVPGIEAYLGIDVPRTYTPAPRAQRNEVPLAPGQMVNGDPRFWLMLKKNGSLDLAPEDIGGFDAVFIDGDHGREAVTHDTWLAWSVVRPGGLVIWHDYNQSRAVDVTAVLDEFCAAGVQLQHVEKTWIAFERRA